jgi:aerobic-type carbon monoxide dehydrogenase small subunit (CoxS/CutS family)
MNAAGLLANNPQPSSDEIDAAMQGNICRCGTYQRIKKAIGEASEQLILRVKQ